MRQKIIEILKGHGIPNYWNVIGIAEEITAIIPKPKTEADLREYLMQWHKSGKDSFSLIEFLNWINS